jgi:hypothetical protein
MRNNYTFNEIFREDGLYTSVGNFSNGVALEVKNGVLSLIEFSTPTDLLPKTLHLVISNEIVNNFRYMYVMNKKQLWR